MKLSPIVVNAEEQDRYKEGKNEQFTSNAVVIYKDKEETERYKGVSPADLLSGVPGVYSSDARNNGAITPNIRGLQGEGRIPTVVDGTRSEYTVYRGYAGVNNRTYIDPNLISEVKAHKGATELQYGMPHAGGGAIVLNTIDAKDIIPEGKTWGINLKYETNNNSIAPKYPHIAYGERIDTPENFWSFFGDANPELYKTLPSNGKGRFFDDYAFRFAIAGKTANSDTMLAYSSRKQGNYFSGTKDAGVYQLRFEEKDKGINDEGVSNFADVAPPGHETPNTSSENQSILFKHNWRPTASQELKFSYRHSNLEYGEIMNSRAVYGEVIKNLFEYGENSNIGTQWTPAKVRQNAGRIDYKIQPQGSKWLDFKAGAWLTHTNARNNSSGGPIAFPYASDKDFDYEFVKMLLENKQCGNVQYDGAYDPSFILKFDFKNCHITKQDIDNVHQAYKDSEGFYFPNPDGLKIVNPALHITTNKQFGIDLANTFRPHRSLDVTVGLNVHRQKLEGEMGATPFFCMGQGYTAEGICPKNQQIKISPYIFPPKTGKRDEYNGWINAVWKATDKLTLTAGGRWGRFSLEDPDTDARLTSRISERKPVQISTTYLLTETLTPNDEQKAKIIDWDTRRDINNQNRLQGIITEDEWWAEWGKIDNEQWDYVKSLGYDIYDIHSKKFEREWGKLVWYADEHGLYHAYNDPKRNMPPNTYIDRSSASSITTQYKELSDEEKYAPFGKRKDHAFDPSFSVSYEWTPYIRTYARYTQSSRFPSIYEGTVGFSDKYGSYIEERNFYPEVAKNIEVGYVHNLTGFFPKLSYADIKLNYYNNKTENVIDRSDLLSNFFYQYAELKTSGIELQSRLDTGKVFADLGYSYLIKSEMCDEDAGFNLQSSYLSGRSCWTGGFPGGYLRGAIPPKHSISLSIGSRFFDNKLTLGTRFTYHSVSEYKKTKAEGNLDSLGRDLNTYPWDNYYIVDAYGDYAINSNIKLSIIGTNLTNRYYPDALTRTYVPAPGRTFKLGIDIKF